LFVSFATWEAAARALPRIPHDSWVVSHNGISYESEKADPPESTPRELRLLSLCRLVPRKNVEMSIRCVARLRDSGRGDVILRIAGSGPDRARLEQLVDELGLQDHVELLGYVEDNLVPALYRWADVF